MRSNKRAGGSARNCHADHRRAARVRGSAAAKRRHHFDCHSQNMKKIPVTEPEAEEKDPAPPSTENLQPEDETDGLQADLDRFRDLALRSQADFENYKKRAAREKEEAIKYANSALLQQLVSILDNFELGLPAAKAHGDESPIYSGMVLVQKQLNDLLAENG